jgi:probable HAF family extracellular repeat protein
MKSTFTLLAATAAFTALAAAQTPRYSVIDLGTLSGGNSSFANNLNDNRLVAGNASDAQGAQQSVFWWGPFRVNLGAPGLNSGIFGINTSAQASIQAEIAAKDPNHENFCGYGTGLQCLAFLWQRGVLTQLPTLGGYNAAIGNINSKGEIPGAAENSVRDPDCPAGLLSNGNGPQVLDYEAVVWGPKPGDIRELKPLPGDSVGVAIWINDNSQAVGASGNCADTVPPPFAIGRHAVLWDASGVAHDLGNLGGNRGGIGLAINNLGQVVGASSKTNDSTLNLGTNGFLWTRDRGIQDLGTLPGDTGSGAVMINDAGDIVGLSLDAGANSRAVLWHGGVIHDLNDLALSSHLFLLFATAINSSGEICGFGVTEKGDLHAFLATPVDAVGHNIKADSEPLVLSEDVRRLVRERLPLSRFALGLNRPR